MPSAKGALIAIAVLVCAAGSVLLLYRTHRPLAGANAGSAPGILSQLPADAPVVAYIDVAALKKLQGSPLAAILGLAGQDPRQDREYRNFVRDTGFDYARDLDHAAIALWPSYKPGVENQAMAVADGRFDQAKIEAYAMRTGTVTTRGTESIYVVPGHPPVSFSFLSTTRILLTTSETLSILTLIPGAAEKDAMRARIERVAGAPIFAVALTDNLPTSFYDDLRDVPQLQSLARSVQSLSLAGQPDGDVIHLTLDTECDSMKDAIALSTVVDGLRMLGSMALADPKNRRQMSKQQITFLAALLGEAKITHQDRWVRLMLDVTPAMLGEASGRDTAQARGGRPSNASSSSARIPSFVSVLGL